MAGKLSFKSYPAIGHRLASASRRHIITGSWRPNLYPLMSVAYIHVLPFHWDHEMTAMMITIVNWIERCVWNSDMSSWFFLCFHVFFVNHCLTLWGITIVFSYHLGNFWIFHAVVDSHTRLKCDHKASRYDFSSPKENCIHPKRAYFIQRILTWANEECCR